MTTGCLVAVMKRSLICALTSVSPATWLRARHEERRGKGGKGIRLMHASAYKVQETQFSFKQGMRYETRLRAKAAANFFQSDLKK